MLGEFLNSRRSVYWADLLSFVFGKTLAASTAAALLAALMLDVLTDASASVVFTSMAVAIALTPLLSWKSFHAERKIVELKDRITAITTVETLPSVLNASFFMNFAERLRTMSLRQKRAISVITVEIQHFDSLRSVFGKKFGETLITNFAGLIVRAIRVEADLVCRLHETEFTILLIDADSKVANLIAHRLQNAFNHADLGSAIVSTRIGLATLTDADRSVHHVIERARNTRFAIAAADRSETAGNEMAATNAVAA